MSSPKKYIDQCEGCYSPLGDYLDAGHTMDELNVSWFICASHETTPDVPFDTYDDYNY